MPCRSGEPTKEELEYKEQYENNPIFKREIDKRNEWLNKDGERYRKEIRELQDKATYSDNEKIAFNSFMSNFLCKAMNIIGSNDLMQYTFEDMEWWYNEHKYRDMNNSTLLSKSELYSKLDRINSKYSVT